MPLPPPHPDTQYIDERNGLVFPWFTKTFLDVLKTWDLKDKRVFEYGGGHSTTWWRHHAKEVCTVEADGMWILYMGGADGKLIHRPVVAGEVELKSAYVQAIYEYDGQFDIIVIDGSYRDECIAAALTKITDGGIIICDNWDQEGVWDSIMGGRLLDPWPAHLFVEPARAQDARPWKTGYWQIFKCMQSKLNDIYYPASFFCVDDKYSSHRPMLWMALEHIKPGVVLEFGAGYGSTMLLYRYCELQQRTFISYETNKEWAEIFEGVSCWIAEDSYENLYGGYDLPISIVFIDCAPAIERYKLLYEYADKATVIIVHDTEPEANYVYHLDTTLNEFKYRCDLLIEGFPQTTAVSNVYDFERWKGVTLGKFRFI